MNHRGAITKTFTSESALVKFIAQTYGSSWDQRLMVQPSASSTSQQPSSSTAPTTSSQLQSSSSASSSLDARQITQSKLPSSTCAPSLSAYKAKKSAPSSLECQSTQPQIPSSSSTTPSPRPQSSSQSQADSLFYSLTAVGIDNDDLNIRFKIANFIRRAKDIQLQRIADCHVLITTSSNTCLRHCPSRSLGHVYRHPHLRIHDWRGNPRQRT